MKKLSLSITIIFVAVLVCTQAYAELSITGNLEFDTEYDTTSQDITEEGGDLNTTEDNRTNTVDNTIFAQSGRIRIIPYGKTQTGNFFFEALTQIHLDVDGTASTDDVWGKIGTDTFDVQIGRFEAAALFDKPEDTKIVDAPDAPERYEADDARGRLDTPGQIALHIIPSDAVNIELGVAYGTMETKDVDETPDVEDDENITYIENLIGFRPVVALTFGPIEAAVGMDYINRTPQDSDADYEHSTMGFGGRVKGTFGPGSLSIEYASKTDSETFSNGEEQDDVTTNSLGGVGSVTLGSGILGGGVFYTTSEKDGSNNTQIHTQYYVSYAHPLLVDNVTIKYAFSMATADDDLDSNEVSNLDSSATGFTVRLVYDF